jgi:murein endopeptidase
MATYANLNRFVVTIVATLMAPQLASLASEPIDLSSMNVGWQSSTPLGRYTHGRLAGAVEMPKVGPNHLTWDPAQQIIGSPSFRRNGTDYLIHDTLCAIARFRLESPDVARLLIGDISLPFGGSFGPEYGGLGHSSHQNGLDVDIYYPRKDKIETVVSSLREIDVAASQQLMNQFVVSGATAVFVGRGTGLTGPAGTSNIVQFVRKHDNHMHIRWPKQPRAETPSTGEKPNQNLC